MRKTLALLVQTRRYLVLLLLFVVVLFGVYQFPGRVPTKFNLGPIIPPAFAQGYIFPGTGLRVFVGYADTERPWGAEEPRPWGDPAGPNDPNTIWFSGSSGSNMNLSSYPDGYDTAALRFENTSGSPITIRTVVVDFPNHQASSGKQPNFHLDLWKDFTIPAKKSTVLASTSLEPTIGDPPSLVPNFDSSEYLIPGAINYDPLTGFCYSFVQGDSSTTPVVSVTLSDGSFYQFRDWSHILDTYGIDPGYTPGCPQVNESTLWCAIGQSCAATTVTISPDETACLNGPNTQATLTGHVTDASNSVPLTNAPVSLYVENGPNNGLHLQTHTNDNGDYLFQYSGSSTGTDDVIAEFPDHFISPRYGSATTHVTWVNAGNCRPAKYSISGSIFVDLNLNKHRDAGESAYSGGTVTFTRIDGGLNGSEKISPNNGDYTISGLDPGTYNVNMTAPNPVPSPYKMEYPGGVPFFQVTVGPGCNVTDGATGGTCSGDDVIDLNFAIKKTYSVSGHVFNDVNKNRLKDGGESDYPGGTVDISPRDGGTINSSGPDYLVSGLDAGTYNIYMTNPVPPPAPFKMVYPLGAPPTLQVTIGPGCRVNDTSTGGSCDGNDNVNDLNFALSGSWPWFQAYDGDVRFDNGRDDAIPSSPTCPGVVETTALSSQPGVAYSGDQNFTTGLGQISSKNWLAGGGIYSEIYGGGALETSYTSLLHKFRKANVPLVDLSTVCDLNNCNLPANLADGVYQAKGDVILPGYHVQPNSNFIFLISGKLTITGDIRVKGNGGSAGSVLFSTGGDMIVAPNVGVSPACPVAKTSLEGFFSTEHDFTVQGYNNYDCVSHGPDNMLNVAGSIVVNSSRTGGGFTVNRDLCELDPQIPAFTASTRPDLILNAWSYLMKQKTISHEEAP